MRVSEVYLVSVTFASWVMCVGVESGAGDVDMGGGGGGGGGLGDGDDDDEGGGSNLASPSLPLPPPRSASRRRSGKMQEQVSFIDCLYNYFEMKKEVLD